MPRILLLLPLWLMIAACASMTPDYDPPKISVEAVRSAPGSSNGTRFEIDLRILNPNQQDLDIAGISYDMGIQGVDLISGVTNNVPLIKGYSQEVVTLEAGVNTLQLIRFFAEMGTGSKDMNSLEYQFSAKIDFNGFMPTQRITESGVIGGLSP